MRILQISSSNFFSSYGGGQIYLKRLVNELVLKGINPIIAVPRIGVEPKNQNEDFDIVTFDPEEGISSILDLLLLVKPQLIHAHGFKDLFSKAGHELNIPVIITAHHGGILCPAGSLLNHQDQICQVKATQSNCLPCVMKNIRWGMTAYPLINSFPTSLHLSLGKVVKKLPFIPYISPVLGASLSIQIKAESWGDIIAYSSLMIAPSNAIQEAMIRNGYPKDKIMVIPHGIPLPKEAQVKDIPSPEDPIKLFYLGRINYVKGIHILCQAFESISQNVELYIFGGAVTKEEKKYLKNLKKRFKRNPGISWKGIIPAENVFETIRQIDLMIHPTIALEVFGLNIAETLALGIPVIATRCGGAEMQIIDGENGYLVEPNNQLDLKKAIQKFIENPKVLQVKAKEVLSIENHVCQLIKIYEAFIN